MGGIFSTGGKKKHKLPECWGKKRQRGEYRLSRGLDQEASPGRKREHLNSTGSLNHSLNTRERFSARQKRSEGSQPGKK